MKQSEIEVGERYAAHFGGHAFEIAEVIVQDAPDGGAVKVEVIHPEDVTDPDIRRDIRTVPTRALLGGWNSRPDPNSKATEHVTYADTFADQAEIVWLRVQQQREIADRLSALGIPTERVAWLGRGGDTAYSPTVVAKPPISVDDLTILLSLAEGRRPAEPEAWAWLVTDLTKPWQPGEPISIGGVFATHDQAVKAADNRTGEEITFTVQKVVAP